MRLIFLGGRLRHLRLQSGLTQLQVAEALGVTDRAVSAWERGIAQPKREHYTKLVAAYERTALDLSQCLVVRPETDAQFADVAEALGIDAVVR